MRPDWNNRVPKRLPAPRTQLFASDPVGGDEERLIWGYSSSNILNVAESAVEGGSKRVEMSGSMRSHEDVVSQYPRYTAKRFDHVNPRAEHERDHKHGQRATLGYSARVTMRFTDVPTHGVVDTEVLQESLVSSKDRLGEMRFAKQGEKERTQQLIEALH